MNERVTKAINKHQWIMAVTIFIGGFLIGICNYVDNTMALHNSSYPDNTYLILALIVNILIGVIGLKAFLEKVLSDLFDEHDLKQKETSDKV